MEEEMMTLRFKGYCCSQIIGVMCLKRMGKEDPDIIEGLGGFCFGMHCGDICGIITAAAFVLHLHDPEEAEQWQIKEFSQWFEESYGSKNCEGLLEGNPINKSEKCPGMIAGSVERLLEIMDLED